jgi:hypothetical protein
VVLEVESLERAREVLIGNDLLGTSGSESIELAPAKSWGLRIILKGPRPTGSESAPGA